jgi:hypothetical protein
MRLPALALLALTSPAGADTFAERWPQPVAVEPAPVATPAPRRVREAHAEHRGFVCHRETYYRGHHRYWRCRR